MVAIMGHEGNISLPSGSGVLQTWSARITRQTSETTAFGTTTNRLNRAGLIDISGSASGHADDTATTGAPDINFGGSLPAAGGTTMTLTCQTGNTLTFEGLISAVSFDVTKFGDSLITFDFVTGDGDTLTETWG